MASARRVEKLNLARPYGVLDLLLADLAKPRILGWIIHIGREDRRIIIVVARPSWRRMDGRDIVLRCSNGIRCGKRRLRANVVSSQLDASVRLRKVARAQNVGFGWRLATNALAPSING
jgi:hypothetical protein